eukprot:jgi/Chlat1/97/Chrsp1S03084
MANDATTSVAAVPQLDIRTTAAHKVTAHALRLLPGQDLLQELLDFAQKKQLRAAFIYTCVGSLSLARLRPAGRNEAKHFDAAYEIVSLTGTLSKTGEHHMHMSISDEDCQTYGGHVLKGCIVRTTAEVVLGELEGLNFKRLTDPRSGYDELFMQPQS